MSSILSNELISKRKPIDNVTRSGLNKVNGILKYPVLYLTSVEPGDQIEVLETTMSINGTSFSLINKTIAELLLEINGTDGIVAEITAEAVAGLPAILLEEFSSVSVVTEEITKSPIRLSSIYSDIIDNIPSSKISSALSREVYEVRDSNGKLLDFTTDSNFIYIEKMSGRCTVTVSLELSSFVLFLKTDKFSTAFTSISQMDEGPDKRDVITSISSHNSSLL